MSNCSLGADGPVITADSTPPEQPLLALDSGGHTGAIYKLARSTYADQLISVSLDKTIRFWDINTGEPVRVLRPPVGRGFFGDLFAVAISPDGKRLAVAGYRVGTPLYDHRIDLISLPDGQIVHSLKGHIYAIQDLAFSPDGKYLASASIDKTLRLWDPESGAPLKLLAGHTDIVQTLSWSPDSRRIVSGSVDKTARIWSVESGATETVLRNHTAQLSGVSWSPDGRSIATGGHDRVIHLYEPSGKLRYSWRNLPNKVAYLVFAPDSKSLLYTFVSNESPPFGAAILDMVDGHERARYSGHTNGVVCGAFLHDGKLVATADTVSGICLWDPSTGKTVRRLEGQGKAMYSAGWSPDGQAIAWGTSNGNIVEHIGGPLERTFCFNKLDFGPRPDGTFFRAQPRMAGLNIGMPIDNGQLDMRTLAVVRSGALVSRFKLPQPDDVVRSYSLLRGGRVALGSAVSAFILDANSGAMLRELNDRGAENWGLAPSPDYRYLLIANNDQICRVWTMNADTPLVSLFVAGDEWIAWTPEGYYAASLAGESLMGWHINHGFDQMATFYPASQFHKSLYRPDVIRRILTAGDLHKALALADNERAMQSQKLKVADVLPPQVTISTPSDPVATASDAPPLDPPAAESPQQIVTNKSAATGIKIRATAKAVDKEPVKDLRLIVDGRPYGPLVAIDKPAVEGAEQDTVEHEWDATLPPGKHELVVKADTAHSYGLSPPLTVVRPSFVDGGEQTDPATITKGNLYALAIGAGSSTAGPNSPAGPRDSQAVLSALAKAGKSQFQQVITRELDAAAATPAAIQQELDAMRARMSQADTGVIYFAGQDALDDNGNYVLRGGSKNTPAAGNVSTTKFQQQLAAIPGRLLLMLDLTHAAERSRRESTAGFCGSSENQDDGRKADNAASEWLRELLTEDYGVAVISVNHGADATPAPKGLSPLTQAFSEGLSGSADANQDGTVDTQELGPYLTKRVRTLSGDRQTPTVERPRGVRSFPLGKTPTPAK